METEIKDNHVEIETILNYKVTKQDLIEFDRILFQEILFNSRCCSIFRRYINVFWCF